jgi:hypothetical protein
MAKAIEQIERDLTKLKSQSRELGEELFQSYQKYFDILTTAIEQQTIQATYYLCTNSYPEEFLQLSYSQREHLLKALQRVIKNAIAELKEKLSPSARVDSTSESTAVEINSDRFADPELLYAWQKELEGEIKLTTQSISHKINVLLQQAQILPSSIPKPILEATTKAVDRGENMANVPNILSILVEQEDEDEEDEDSDRDDNNLKIIQIDSLYLRLSEIEFVDMMVMSGRKQINHLVSKLRNLRREYRHQQQELKIAEAESAWRNSWFET